MMDYQYFTVNDFADDVGFRNYVLRKNSTDIAFWTQWLDAHPNKKEMAAEAEKLVLLLAAEARTTDKNTISSSEKAEEWDKLWSRINTETSTHVTEVEIPVLQPIKGGKNRWLWVAAASLALLVSATFFISKKDTPPQYKDDLTAISKDKKDTLIIGKEKLLPTAKITDNTEFSIKTPFGKTKQVTLPDGSTVLLNANSQLRFPKNWSKTADRMVWLDGEAEFSVKHYDLEAGQKQKFIVYTEGVKVEVVGTRFNLMSRAEKCKLALYEGKVQLLLNKHPEQESIAIDPNEVVQVDNGAVVRILPIKKIEVYQAWTKQHFEFDDTPLSEVASMVENTYGYTFIFKDEKLKTKRLTASIPDDDVAVLMKVISQIFNIKTQNNGKEILLESNK
jgi:ferric-dicitrate binding protein FerR (iron transport regulator)